MSALDDYIKNRDEARKIEAENKKAEEARIESADNFDKSLNDFVGQYRKWAKDNKSDKFADKSDDEIKERMVNLIRETGATDKGFGEGDYDSKDYYDYGSEFIGGIGNRRKMFDKISDDVHARKEVYDKLSDDDKSALVEVLKYQKNLEEMKSNKPNKIQSQYAGIDQDKLARGLLLRKALSEVGGAYSKKKDTDNFMDVFENYESYRGKDAKAKEEKASEKDGKKGGEEADDGETIEFMLTRGNDPNYKGFGQKILDLGIGTDNGLWGENGDVAYYTKQLNDQGIYGNLPIGKTIRLKRRK